MEEDKKKLSKKTSPKARGDKSKDKKKAKKGKKANFALYTKLLKKANKALDNGSTKSCKLFNKALSHNSKGVKAYIGLGWCNLDQNNLKNAEKFFKKAKVISPSFSEAYWGLAEVYGAMGKNPWKKIWCKQYLKIAPNGEFKGQAKNCIR